MDINELESFKLSDAVKFHDNLNPALWTKDAELLPEVSKQLMVIAKDFLSFLGIPSFKVEDITISGSNAAYSYTPHSDIDLHVLVDFSKLPNDEVYKELFTAKKQIYNDDHNITIHNVPVELYVQDSNQKHVTLGEYSLLKNKWIKIPSKRRANFDQTDTRIKYEKLGKMIELALELKDLVKVEKVLDIIKRYRRAGLDKHGEFGPENLAYKALRKQGIIQDLFDLRKELHGSKLSIEEVLDPKSASELEWEHEGEHWAPYYISTAIAKDKNNNRLKYDFIYFSRFDLTSIEFSRAVTSRGSKYEINKAGDQYTVFATLIEAIKQYLSENKPKFILFSAKEPSRVKLYKTFVNRFAGKFGYKQISPDNIPDSVRSRILSSSETPFLLQKVESKPVKESVKFIEGTNCKNCVWWKKDSEKPVGKDELNKYGGLKPPNKEYIAMSKRVDLVTLPGKDSVKEKAFCYHKDINDWVTERMCCAKWDGKGVLRDYKGESPLMEENLDEASGYIQKLFDFKQDLHSRKLSIDEILDKDSAAKKIYWSQENVDNVFPNKMYTIHTAATQDKNKNILKYNFYNFPHYDLTAIEFSRAVGLFSWGDNFSVDNAGDQYTVFATLLEAIKQYLSEEQPKYILFGAKEPNRAKLYQAFVNRFASQFGYKQISANSIPKPVTSVILSSDDTAFLLQKIGTDSVKEASGYIPSEKEKNDPRFKTALTVDVKPDSIQRNAKAFGFKVARNGRPPLLRK